MTGREREKNTKGTKEREGEENGVIDNFSSSYQSAHNGVKYVESHTKEAYCNEWILVYDLLWYHEI